MCGRKINLYLDFTEFFTEQHHHIYIYIQRKAQLLF